MNSRFHKVFVLLVLAMIPLADVSSMGCCACMDDMGGGYACKEMDGNISIVTCGASERVQCFTPICSSGCANSYGTHLTCSCVPF